MACKIVFWLMYIHLWHVSCRTRRTRLCARLYKASKTATLKWLDPMTSEGINWINPTFLESVEQIFADELVTNHQLGLCAARINFGHLWAFYSATPICGDMAWESYDTMCPYVIMVCLEKLKAVAPGSTTKIKTQDAAGMYTFHIFWMADLSWHH